MAGWGTWPIATRASVASVVSNSSSDALKEALGRTRDLVIGLDRVIPSLARHWLLFINLATDLSYAVLDPRIRLS